MLADGEFHSGDDLGGRLGVSRAAVWKRLQKLQALGVPLESIKGKGYRIEGGRELLQADRIQQALSPESTALISKIETLLTTTSTNQVALRNVAEIGAGYVCVAEQQTEGRGRRGRKWVSPFGSSLYFSIGWEFSGGAAALEGLSLAVGVAVVSALQKLAVPDVQLKWPNDILHNNRKLAGILIEMGGDVAGLCQVVVGVGINVSLPQQLREVIDQPYIDLKSVTEEAPGRNRLLAEVLNELMPLLAEFESRKFSAYRERWQALDAYGGEEVFIQIGDSAEFGIAAGVDDSGALILETAAGKKIFSGGEVSLRKR